MVKNKVPTKRGSPLAGACAGGAPFVIHPLASMWTLPWVAMFCDRARITAVKLLKSHPEDGVQRVKAHEGSPQPWYTRALHVSMHLQHSASRPAGVRQGWGKAGQAQVTLN